MFFYILDLQGSQTERVEFIEWKEFFYILDLQGSQTVRDNPNYY